MITIDIKEENETLVPVVTVTNLGEYTSLQLASIFMFLLQKSYAEPLFYELKSRLSEHDFKKIAHQLAALTQLSDKEDEDNILEKAKTPIFSPNGLINDQTNMQ